MLVLALSPLMVALVTVALKCMFSFPFVVLIHARNAGYDATQPTNVYLYNNVLSRCGFDANTDRGVTGGKLFVFYVCF